MEVVDMLKKLNMSRKVDTLGRVVIPKSIRDELNIQVGEELEIAMIDGWVAFGKTTEKEQYIVAKQVLEGLGLEIPKELIEKCDE